MAEPSGFRCETCRKWVAVDALLMAQTAGELLVTCRKCNSRYSIVSGHVQRTRRGRGAKAK